MHRRKTLLSAGPILMLIGAAAPAAVQAEASAGLENGSQKAAQAATPAARERNDQAELLNRPVTLDLVDAPLGSVLEAIARDAGVMLAYNADILPAGRTATLQASALPARDAFARVLDGTGLKPSVTQSGHVMLARTADAPGAIMDTVADVPRQATITGTVTDAETGEPLGAAEVRIDGSELSTATNAEGTYTLDDVPPGPHTLVASMIGYGEAREAVTVTAGTTATVDFALTVSAVPLDEVVVTGTMVPTQVRAVPSPVSVITAEEIDRKGAVRFQDVLRSIPGVGVVSSNGEDPRLFFLYVRGANTLGANTIKTYVDGFELANPIYSLNQIDPASIERIEVIRGPQASTLYGPEAMAGVLQIFTKKGRPGERTRRLQATLSGGNLESQYADGLTPIQNHSLRFTGGDDNASFSLGGAYRYTGEWVEDELIDELGWDHDNSVSTDVDLSGGFRYTLGNVTADASARFHRNAAALPISKALTDPARKGEWDYAYATKPRGTKTELDAQTFGLNLTYAATPWWIHHLTVGYDGTVVEYRRPQPRVTTAADTFLRYQSLDWERRSITYRTAVELTLGKRLSSTLQVGFDRSSYSHEEVITFDATQLTGGLGNESADITLGELVNHGLFLQTQTAWRNQLYLTAGVRADESTGFGDDLRYVWSPRAGLAHVVDLGPAELKTRASYGKAIRAPQPEQKLGRTGGDFITLPNDELGAETQIGYDVGAELHFADGNLSLGVTHYRQVADDLVALVRMTDPTDLPTVQQYQNIGRITNHGWEFEVAANIASITVKGQYALLDSEVKQLSPTYTGTSFVVGQRPLWVPRNTGELSLTHRTSRTTTTLTMTHKGSWQTYQNVPYFDALLGTDPSREPYRGSRRDYVDDYDPVRRYSLNASVRLTRHMSALLMIDNLFDDYTPDRSDSDLVRGRQILIGMRMDLGL